MFTRFSKITPKIMQQLQSTDGYEQARRNCVAIREKFGAGELLLLHLAQFWGVPEAEIIAELSPKKLSKVA